MMSPWVAALMGAFGGGAQAAGQVGDERKARAFRDQQLAMQRDREASQEAHWQTEEERQRAAGEDADKQRAFENAGKLVGLRDQFGLVDPTQARSEAGAAMGAAPSMPGGPMSVVGQAVAGAGRAKQLTTAPSVSLPDPSGAGGALSFVMDPQRTKFAREENAKARDRMDQIRMQTQIATANREAAIQAQNERAASDRASRETIAREGNDTRRAIAAALGDRQQAARDAKPASDAQNQAAGYFNRMTEAEQAVKALGDKGAPTAGTMLKGRVPIIGDLLQNSTMTPEQQQYRQAQENWITANLRKESGAAIPVAEIEAERKKWFTMPGDKPELIAQKTASRQTAIANMRRNAARALAPGGGGDSGGSSAATPQQLWDAAVAKHGRAKVLQEFGPRPQ